MLRHHVAADCALILFALTMFRGCSCSREPELPSKKAELPKQAEAKPVTPDADPKLSPEQPPGAPPKSASPPGQREEQANAPGKVRGVLDTVVDFASSFSGSGRKREQVTPEIAHSQASDLLETGERKASDGDYGEAYSKTLAAWETVTPHAKHDGKCASLEQTLLGRLEEYGEEANRRTPEREASFKPLVIQ